MNKKNFKIYLLLFFLTGLVSCIYDREFDEPLKVCFVRSSNIWIMDMDGGNQEQLTFSGLDSRPSWSPDGMKIVFQSSRDGNDEIFTMDYDGSNIKQLTYTAGADYSSYPTWLPDGENIIFRGNRSGSAYVFIISDSGDVIKQFPDGSLSPLKPTCSPDGKFAIFIVGPGYLSRMDTSTGVFTNITSTVFNGGHSWSPDKGTICFSYGTSDLNIGDPMGYDSYSTIATGSFYDPCWTANGKRIIFSTAATTGNISSMTPDGLDIQVLTSTGLDSQPCVQGKPR